MLEGIRIKGNRVIFKRFLGFRTIIPQQEDVIERSFPDFVRLSKWTLMSNDISKRPGPVFRGDIVNLKVFNTFTEGAICNAFIKCTITKVNKKFDVGMVFSFMILYFPHSGSAITLSIVGSAYKCLAKNFICRKTREFQQGGVISSQHKTYLIYTKWEWSHLVLV
jgi:hypothetical protein